MDKRRLYDKMKSGKNEKEMWEFMFEGLILLRLYLCYVLKLGRGWV
jgi:hypothetical protein